MLPSLLRIVGLKEIQRWAYEPLGGGSQEFCGIVTNRYLNSMGGSLIGTSVLTTS